MNECSWPFQLTMAEISRSSTLEKSDLGSWAVIIAGCVQIVSSRKEGIRLYNMIKAENDMAKHRVTPEAFWEQCRKTDYP